MSTFQSPWDALAAARGMVKEYDNSWADEASGGTINLKPLAGSIHTDRFSVDWNISAGTASFNTAEINASDGVHSLCPIASIDFDMSAKVADLVAVGGGPALDTRKDILWFVTDIRGVDMPGTWYTYTFQGLSGSSVLALILVGVQTPSNPNPAIFTQTGGSSSDGASPSSSNLTLSIDGYGLSWRTRYQSSTDPDRADPADFTSVPNNNGNDGASQLDMGATDVAFPTAATMSWVASHHGNASFQTGVSTVNWSRLRVYRLRGGS